MLQRKVCVEGITYAGNHGLEILHPDGTRFNHPMPAGYVYRIQVRNMKIQATTRRGGGIFLYDNLQFY